MLPQETERGKAMKMIWYWINGIYEIPESHITPILIGRQILNHTSYLHYLELESFLNCRIYRNVEKIQFWKTQYLKMDLAFWFGSKILRLHMHHEIQPKIMFCIGELNFRLGCNGPIEGVFTRNEIQPKFASVRY